MDGILIIYQLRLSSVLKRDMKLFGAETVELRQFRRMLEYSGLWFPGHKSALLYVQTGRLLSYLLTVILWNWSLSRIPLHLIPRKSFTPIVIWSNFHFLTVLYLAIRSAGLRSWVAGMSGLLAVSTSTSPTAALLFRRLTSRTWRYITASFGHVILITGVISFLPTLVDLGYLLTSTSKEPFYVPMTLEGFLPDTKTRSFLFYFLNMTNGLLVIIPSVYYVALLTALPATVTYIYYELEVMELELEKWAEDRRAEDGGRRAAHLGRVIVQHATLLRYINIIKELLGTAFSTQNFVGSVNTGFLLHSAKKAFHEGDVMLIVQQIYFFTQLIGVTFLCCYIGEILHEKGKKVCETVYGLCWYEESPQVRRDLLMVLRATQQPIVFDLKKKVPLNLQTFAELVNRAYTIFILLESVQPGKAN